MLAIKRPKKKDQIPIGSLIINHSKIRDKSRILLMIPENKERRNAPLSFRQTSVNPSFFISLISCQENLFILSKSSL